MPGNSRRLRRAPMLLVPSPMQVHETTTQRGAPRLAIDSALQAFVVAVRVVGVAGCTAWSGCSRGIRPARRYQRAMTQRTRMRICVRRCRCIWLEARERLANITKPC
jgi:hypothetical protein